MNPIFCIPKVRSLEESCGVGRDSMDVVQQNEGGSDIAVVSLDREKGALAMRKAI